MAQVVEPRATSIETSCSFVTQIAQSGNLGYPADPLGQMKNMYQSLNMSGFEGLQAVLEPQVESLRRYKKNKFNDDREVMQRIYNRLKFAFDRYGYPPPHLDIAAA